MNKLTRIAVWAFLVSILASGVVLASRAFGADDYKTLSHQYDLVYQSFLIKKIKTLDKGTPVILYFKDRTEVAGIFKGYSSYDDSIWIKEKGHLFQDGYGISELQDITINVKRPI